MASFRPAFSFYASFHFNFRICSLPYIIPTRCTDLSLLTGPLVTSPLIQNIFLARVSASLRTIFHLGSEKAPGSACRRAALQCRIPRIRAFLILLGSLTDLQLYSPDMT